jgi:hypothetical protein
MANFPTLSIKPLVEGSEIKPEHDVITNKFYGGFEYSRAQNNHPRETFPVSYIHMSAADFATLQTFYMTTAFGESEIFTMEHPYTLATIDAKFVNNSFSYSRKNNGKYDVKFEIKTV